MFNMYVFIITLQLEADLRVAQAEFDRQYEVTKLLLDGVTTAQVCCYPQFETGKLSAY